MLRIAVCDDNEEFLARAVQFVRMWADESGMPTEVLSFNNGDDLLREKASHRIDLIILDILMPLLNGIDTAREIRQTDKNVRIIFLTSSPEFALDSYEVKAQGYLLKPVKYEKVKEVLEECRHSMEEEPKHTVLKTAFGYQKLYFHDIECAEAQNKKVVFYLRSGKTVEISTPLHTIEERFINSDGFFKCHRSYIVYLPNVDRFSMTEVVMKSGRIVPIARGVGKAFQEAYFAYMFVD